MSGDWPDKPTRYTSIGPWSQRFWCYIPHVFHTWCARCHWSLGFRPLRPFLRRLRTVLRVPHSRCPWVARAPHRATRQQRIGRRPETCSRTRYHHLHRRLRLFPRPRSCHLSSPGSPPGLRPRPRYEECPRTCVPRCAWRTRALRVQTTTVSSRASLVFLEARAGIRRAVLCPLPCERIGAVSYRTTNVNETWWNTHERDARAPSKGQLAGWFRNTTRRQINLQLTNTLDPAYFGKPVSRLSTADRLPPTVGRLLTESGSTVGRLHITSHLPFQQSERNSTLWMKVPFNRTTLAWIDTSCMRETWNGPATLDQTGAARQPGDWSVWRSVDRPVPVRSHWGRAGEGAGTPLPSPRATFMFWSSPEVLDFLRGALLQSPTVVVRLRLPRHLGLQISAALHSLFFFFLLLALGRRALVQASTNATLPESCWFRGSNGDQERVEMRHQASTFAAVALTQISAKSTHKNLALRKIMEAMRTAYAKKWDSVSTLLKIHMRQTITEATRVLWKESAHRLRRTFFFAQSFPLLPFVGTHFRSVRKLFVHLRTVYASPQKLARSLHLYSEWSSIRSVISSRLWAPTVNGRHKVHNHDNGRHEVHNQFIIFSEYVIEQFEFGSYF